MVLPVSYSLLVQLVPALCLDYVLWNSSSPCSWLPELCDRTTDQNRKVCGAFFPPFVFRFWKLFVFSFFSSTRGIEVTTVRSSPSPPFKGNRPPFAAIASPPPFTTHAILPATASPPTDAHVPLGLLVAYEGMWWSPAPEPAPHQRPLVLAPRKCSPVPLLVPSSSPVPLLVLSSSPVPLLVPSSSPVPLLVPSSSPEPLLVPSSSPVPLLVPSSSPEPLLVPSSSPVPLLVPSVRVSRTPPSVRASRAPPSVRVSTAHGIPGSAMAAQVPGSTMAAQTP